MQTIELKGNDELKVSFVKFLLKQNYMHKKNEFNQVSLMGLSVFGVADKPKAGSRRPSRSDDNSIVPRRQDLAFLMYTDKDVAEVISSGHNSIFLTNLNFPPKQKSPFSKNHYLSF